MNKNGYITRIYVSKFPDLFVECDKDLEKIVLMLRKGLTCYEYIESWKNLNKKLMPGKEKSSSKLKKISRLSDLM